MRWVLTWLTSFHNRKKGTLESALDSIEGARSGMDNASRILTGPRSGVDLGNEPQMVQTLWNPQVT